MSSTTAPPHSLPTPPGIFLKNHGNIMHGTLQHLTPMRSRILWSSHNTQHGSKKFGGTSLGLCFVYGHPKFHYFIFFHLLNLQWATSKFNNSCTMGLNMMKPPWCTLTHQGLSNGTKSAKGCWEGGGGGGCCRLGGLNVTKQNKQVVGHIMGLSFKWHP
jgi:hypothetical protein